VANSKEKVLVIDDSLLNIMHINNILKDDYEVYFGTDGNLGLKKAVEIIPDIILLDVLMPDMDGYEVINELKNNSLTKDIPVIFLTALDTVEQEVKGLEAGAVDYVTKPIVGPLLKARLKIHLELKKQRDYLQNLTMIDGLTGIANKKRLNEYIDKWYRISFRKKTYLSIFMIDIDHFKLFNDTYGHIAGDDCLKKIASEIKNSLKRPYDLAARFGGEEFTCVIPEANYQDAIQIAKRIKKNIDLLKIEHKSSPVLPYVTVSIGGITTVPKDTDGYSKILEKADEALYEAKKNGRNQIVIKEL